MPSTTLLLLSLPILLFASTYSLSIVNDVTTLYGTSTVLLVATVLLCHGFLLLGTTYKTIQLPKTSAEYSRLVLQGILYSCQLLCIVLGITHSSWLCYVVVFPIAEYLTQRSATTRHRQAQSPPLSLALASVALLIAALSRRINRHELLAAATPSLNADNSSNAHDVTTSPASEIHLIGILLLLMSTVLHYASNYYEKKHLKHNTNQTGNRALVSIVGGVMCLLLLMLAQPFSAISALGVGDMGMAAFMLLSLWLAIFWLCCQFAVQRVLTMTSSATNSAQTQGFTSLPMQYFAMLLSAIVVNYYRSEGQLTLSMQASLLCMAAAVAIQHITHNTSSTSTLSFLLPLTSNSKSTAHYYDAMSTSSTINWKSLRKFIVNDPTSLRIALFLCLNFLFMFVELGYGYLSNSLGLISDAGHMLFDCTALLIGLYASYTSKLKSNSVYTYGYGRYETLSGFGNGIFLLFIGYFVFVEAVERLASPVPIAGDNLVVVSVMGFLVNMVGLIFFHDSHAHSHGGGGDHHGHSHGGSNHNIDGIFLHILADALGSLGVIISSLLVTKLGWSSADAICSIVISVLIVLSSIPLCISTATILLQQVSTHTQSDMIKAQHTILRMQGVLAIEDMQVWQLTESESICTMQVDIDSNADEQALLQSINSVLRHHVTARNITVELRVVAGKELMNGAGGEQHYLAH